MPCYQKSEVFQFQFTSLLILWVARKHLSFKMGLNEITVPLGPSLSLS